MRRPVAIALTALTIALIALSLHTLSAAKGHNQSQLLQPLFASSINPPSIITGTVFEDANGNEEQDAGEMGIPNVTVSLDDDIKGTITTDPNGKYLFYLTWADNYTVTATTPPGYFGTTPESVPVQISGPGQEEIVDFGYRTLFTRYLPIVGKSFP